MSCGAICKASKTCVAYEWQNSGATCKTKDSYNPKAGAQYVGWTSCVSTSKAPDGGILVLNATYGMNCNARLSGNQGKNLGAACDGKATCSYYVDHTVIGDPARGCAKEYVLMLRMASCGFVTTIIIA